MAFPNSRTATDQLTLNQPTKNMPRLITTRAQREALFRLFIRENELTEETLTNFRKEVIHLYRTFRKRFQWSGFGSDKYLFGPMYDGAYWVGIELDGYTHS